MPSWPRPTRRVAALAVTILLAVMAGTAPPAGSADAGSLNRRVTRDRQHEHALASSLVALDALIARLDRGQAILSGRLTAVQGELDSTLARLEAARQDLRAARVHLRRLRAQLTRGRTALAGQLVAQYTSPQADLVNVMLSATSFSDLLDQAEFLHRVAHANAQVVSAVRRARDRAHGEQLHLTTLTGLLRDSAITVTRRRDALAAIRAALRVRQTSLGQARAARAAALRNTTASRHRAERQLAKLQAQQTHAASSSTGPGGPWAIPWAIVQCESGGQNVPPNFATASGYYQMTDATWRGLGGRTPHAYQASKAEQDAAAARLWAGGSGASNWVCAGLVGR
jgi:peptidoglycan hydrolase CwlO-like protein